MSFHYGGNFHQAIRRKGQQNVQQELQCELTLKKAVLQAIDESLRSKPFNGCGITYKTIQEARRYIKSHAFYDRYEELHGIKPYILVRKLKLMWYDLETYWDTAEKHSLKYRRIFNAGNGAEVKIKRMELDYEA